ncbi:MAG: tRNA (adenosine(37)-N6)-threonylcarbamoyltransferase complex ATPase subunit type 1 TsaE [Gammaproteobacteria bacterium]
MGESLELKLPDEAATEELGAALAHGLAAAPGEACLIALQGELGAGKTTLVRGLLRAAGHTGPVPSPTYTLVEPYDLATGRLYHLDLYRLADAEELEYLGWRDMTDAVSVVEWPGRAPELVRRADLVVGLAHAGSGRRAGLRAGTPGGSALLARIREAISNLK